MSKPNEILVFSFYGLKKLINLISLLFYIKAHRVLSLVLAFSVGRH